MVADGYLNTGLAKIWSEIDLNSGFQWKFEIRSRKHSSVQTMKMTQKHAILFYSQSQKRGFSFSRSDVTLVWADVGQEGRAVSGLVPAPLIGKGGIDRGGSDSIGSLPRGRSTGQIPPIPRALKL